MLSSSVSVSGGSSAHMIAAAAATGAMPVDGVVTKEETLVLFVVSAGAAPGGSDKDKVRKKAMINVVLSQKENGRTYQGSRVV